MHREGSDVPVVVRSQGERARQNSDEAEYNMHRFQQGASSGAHYDAHGQRQEADSSAPVIRSLTRIGA